jgi:CelD/BcsL family acetyltransferase involved in cellulose biosynthesis
MRRKVERDEFPEIFERAWPLYEFRQIGRYNFNRFLTDADLKRFYLAVAKQSDVLHMTVLRVDETIVAWFLGIQSNGYLHMIAVGYSPFHARHSPAVLHMPMLAKRLVHDERCLLDLTPGGDGYKDKLATSCLCHPASPRQPRNA